MTATGRGWARPRPDIVVVIGTGLIGTSIALALREQDVSVWLADADDQAVILAAEIWAPGSRCRPTACLAAQPDIAVLAVPPAAVAPELRVRPGARSRAHATPTSPA